MIQRAVAIAGMTLLTTCAGGQNYNASLLPSQDGRDHYAVSGLVRTLDPDQPQITHPFVTEQMADACPNGLLFDSGYKEAKLNWTPFGTWVQYNGTVICQDGPSNELP